MATKAMLASQHPNRQAMLISDPVRGDTIVTAETKERLKRWFAEPGNYIAQSATVEGVTSDATVACLLAALDFSTYGPEGFVLITL